MRHLLIFIVTFLVMLALDYVWLKFAVGDFFLKQLGGLARTKNGVFDVNIPAALVVYLIMTLGIIVFVLPLSSSNWAALGYGALFGLVLYAVFEGTNMAIIKDWPIPMIALDVAWGAVVCGLTSLAAHFFVIKIVPKFFN